MFAAKVMGICPRLPYEHMHNAFYQKYGVEVFGGKSTDESDGEKAVERDATFTPERGKRSYQYRHHCRVSVTQGQSEVCVHEATGVVAGRDVACHWRWRKKAAKVVVRESGGGGEKEVAKAVKVVVRELCGAAAHSFSIHQPALVAVESKT